MQTTVFANSVRTLGSKALMILQQSLKVVVPMALLLIVYWFIPATNEEIWGALGIPKIDFGKVSLIIGAFVLMVFALPLTTKLPYDWFTADIATILFTIGAIAAGVVTALIQASPNFFYETLNAVPIGQFLENNFGEPQRQWYLFGLGLLSFIVGIIGWRSAVQYSIVVMTIAVIVGSSMNHYWTFAGVCMIPALCGAASVIVYDYIYKKDWSAMV